MPLLPFEGAEVTAFRKVINPNDGSITWENVVTVITDAAGEYEITGLIPGASYRIRVKDPTIQYTTIYAPAAGGGGAYYAEFDYPGQWQYNMPANGDPVENANYTLPTGATLSGTIRANQ